MNSPISRAISYCHTSTCDHSAVKPPLFVLTLLSSLGQHIGQVTFSIKGTHFLIHCLCPLCPGCGFIYAVDWRSPVRGPPAHLRGGDHQDEPSTGCQVVQCSSLTCSLPSRPEANYCAAPAGSSCRKCFVTLESVAKHSLCTYSILGNFK